MSWTAMGCRVLGVASGKAIMEQKQDLVKISLANLKDHVRDMRLIGFMVINNPLRSDSSAAIEELQKK